MCEAVAKELGGKQMLITDTVTMSTAEYRKIVRHDTRALGHENVDITYVLGYLRSALSFYLPCLRLDLDSQIFFRPILDYTCDLTITVQSLLLSMLTIVHPSLVNKCVEWDAENGEYVVINEARKKPNSNSRCIL